MVLSVYDSLTEEQCRRITALYTLCTKEEGCYVLGLVLPEPGWAEEDSFYLLCEEKGQPASFLSVFCPDLETAEVSGFTAPAFRRRGYFSALLAAAEREIDERFGTVRLLYQCLTGDQDTEGFCKKRGLRFSYGECMMEYNAAGRRTAPSLHDKGFSLRPASSGDRELLISLHRSVFPDTEAEAYMDTVLADEATDSFLILSEGTPAGLFHLTTSGAVSYFMGLGILPAFRGKGLAKAALREVFSMLPPKGRLLLQVSTSNGPAFQLYTSMGFSVFSRLDYYE